MVEETLISSAQACIDQDGQVVIDNAALEAFANHRFQDQEDYNHRIQRVAFPLKFDSPLQEINFHALSALLSFGAGYEDRLEDNARDTILFGLIGLHISRVEPNAGWLCSVNRSDISSLFGINPYDQVPAIPPSSGEEQQPLPVSAITVEKPGVLGKYVDDLVKVMHETGARLREIGCPDLSRFILNTVKGHHSAVRSVNGLATTFPYFEDVVRVGDSEARLRKKAIMLAAELFYRARQTCPDLDFNDLRDLPPYVTASSLNLLLRSGIIKPSDPSQTQGQFLKAKRENVLRTAATVAIHRMHQYLVESKKEVMAVDLAYYLDDLGREEDKALAEERRKGQAAVQNCFVPPRESFVL